jgi:hypothetical protein
MTPVKVPVYGIWGTHNGNFVEYNLVGCNAGKLGISPRHLGVIYHLHLHGL